jgi:hypothetical protein
LDESLAATWQLNPYTEPERYEERLREGIHVVDVELDGVAFGGKRSVWW